VRQLESVRLRDVELCFWFSIGRSTGPVRKRKTHCNGLEAGNHNLVNLTATTQNGGTLGTSSFDEWTACGIKMPEACPSRLRRRLVAQIARPSNRPARAEISPNTEWHRRSKYSRLSPQLTTEARAITVLPDPWTMEISVFSALYGLEERCQEPKETVPDTFLLFRSDDRLPGLRIVRA
jgi:hypothetical protein